MKKLLIILLLSPLFSACGIEQVDEGFRGIETNWGKVVGEPLSPGLYFYNPISSDIFEMSVKEEKIESKTECFTKDTQKVDVTYTVTYYPDPLQIGNLYKQFGRNWDEKVIPQAVLGSLKDATGIYIADELVQKRDVVKQTAEKELKTKLLSNGVIVTRLELINLDFDNKYESAVEAKVVAIQRAIEAKNKTVEVEEQAKQTVLSAKAQAESMRIRSQALSQNKSLVEYEAVQKWDGSLPQIVLGNGSIPILDMSKIMSGEK